MPAVLSFCYNCLSLRIAIILGRLVIGGTTTDTLEAARMLQNEHDLLLVTGGGNRDEFEAAYLTQHLPHVRHERLPGFGSSIQPFADLRAIAKLRKVLRRFNPDIVHTHTAKAGLLGRLAARHLPNTALVHTYHGMVFEGYFSPAKNRLIIAIERMLARYTHAIVALSEGQKMQLVNKFRICSANKIRIVPLGIEVERFQQQQEEKRNRFRDRYCILPHQQAIGIVGRMVPIKNHTLFLECAELVLQEHPNAVFFVVGDGPQRRKCLDICRKMGLSYTFYPEDPKPAQVIFTSWITEVDEVMNGLDMVMLTSINEGTPVSLMEAQAAGKPVVTTAAGGTGEIVRDGVTGLVAHSHEPEILARLVSQLLADEGLRHQMGQAGSQLAAASFRKQKQVEGLLKLYEQLFKS